jgi:hypothetical protein
MCFPVGKIEWTLPFCDRIPRTGLEESWSSLMILGGARPDSLRMEILAVLYIQGTLAEPRIYR